MPYSIRQAEGLRRSLAEERRRLGLVSILPVALRSLARPYGLITRKRRNLSRAA